MPALLTLIVAYAGIGGDGAARIDRQVHALLDRASEVEEVRVDERQRHALASHGSDARAIVRGLHATGVVAGELDGTTLHIVVYDGDGGVVGLVDLALESAALGRDDLDSLRETIVPDVVRLAAEAPPEAPLDASVESEELFDESDPDDEPDPTLHLRATVGLGVVSRTFSPSPATIPGYQTSPVAALRLAAEVAPDPRVAIGVELERTLGLTTTTGNGSSAPSSISRWQATAAYRRRIGALELAPVVGLGQREFVIQSKDTARSPDGHYAYLVLGGRVVAQLGARVSVRGLLAIEPVVAGAEPTAMAFGPATRWALELGAAVEVSATDHLYVAATADYQRFTWSFDRAGLRGAGGAVDAYPIASLALGARY